MAKFQWDGAVVGFTAQNVCNRSVCGIMYTGKVKYVWGAFSCGSAIASATQDLTSTVNVPPQMYGPSDVIVIRMAYDFAPVFTSMIVPTTKIFHQATMNAEWSEQIDVRPGGSSVTYCP